VAKVALLSIGFTKLQVSGSKFKVSDRVRLPEEGGKGYKNMD
jgi:hypothetical protein